MGCATRFPGCKHGIRDDVLDGDLIVHDPVDEGRVRAVLEQAPNQVGQ